MSVMPGHHPFSVKDAAGSPDVHGALVGLGVGGLAVTPPWMPLAGPETVTCGTSSHRE
jgi:hypothetical protein